MLIAVLILFGTIPLLFGLVIFILVLICKKFNKKAISNRLGIIFSFVSIIITFSEIQGILKVENSYSLFSSTYEIDIGVIITLIGAILLCIFSAIGSMRDD